MIYSLVKTFFLSQVKGQGERAASHCCSGFFYRTDGIPSTEPNKTD